MVHIGTEEFKKFLDEKNFKGPETILDYRNGCDVTAEVLKCEGFRQPIIVKNKDGLGLKVPPTSFQVADLLNYLDLDTIYDVGDVYKQKDDFKMTLGDFVKYFNSTDRERQFREENILYNFTTLEISKSKLGNLFEPPTAVRNACMINLCWIEEDKVLPEKQSQVERPAVSKHLNIGTAYSYTTFHTDYGGSAVWNHVLWGHKVFYLIPPTPENLSAYENWMNLDNDNLAFLGDFVPNVYKVDLYSGDTLFLPSGWIHSVFTETDSLVFAGNFLTIMGIPRQIEIYDLERRISYRYCFPQFLLCHWFAAKFILDQLTLLSKHTPEASDLLQAAIALLPALTKWLNCAKALENSSNVLPRTFDASTLISKLSKMVSSLQSLRSNGSSMEPTALHQY